MYDVAVYSLFGTLIFFIIIHLISLGIQLEVTTDGVDYITQQVNQQRKEYEEAVHRFVYDAFFVRKYYENRPATFELTETLSTQQALSKYKEMKKERNVDKAINEISKHLTMLSKMKVVMDQPEEKQFDSKFMKLIKELHETGQTTTRKGVNRIKQDKKLSKTQEDKLCIVFRLGAKVVKGLKFLEEILPKLSKKK
uniref:Antigen n=1 Tax=Loa loa TaxID=7209 RepID=A0A1I7VUN6_LOALO